MKPLATARALLASRRGSSAVEFALVVLPLMLMSMAAIEFVRLQWARNALQEVAIASARCIGMKAAACGTAGSYDATKALAFVKAEGSGWKMTLANGNIAITPGATCQGISGFSQVTITYAFTSPFLGAVTQNGFSIDATACFPNRT